MRWNTQRAGVVALGLAAGFVCASAPATSVAVSCLDVAGEQRALAQLNSARQSQQLCPRADTSQPVASQRPASALRLHPLLASASTVHAHDLASRDAMSHEDVQSRPLKQRLKRVGYELQIAAETLATGVHTFEQALALWLASPSHCATLMSGAFTEVGLACVQRSGTRLGHFWVAQFATRQSP
jgi:uncharacterized protein YkwD